ncbi:MAG: GldG family protein [Candidatus Schekmanbacteria bacterium]|nr:GldG family protein [Candidatus Schekmanbacteria bacterium]
MTNTANPVSSAPPRSVAEWFMSILDILWVVAVVGGLLAYSYEGVWHTWIKVLLGVGGALFLVFLVTHRSGIGDLLASRSTRYGTNMAIVIAAFLFALIVLNYLGDRHSKRVDMTKEGIYTLSDQTTKVLAQLAKPVQVVAFFQKLDEGGKRQAEDLLQEYKHYAKDFSVEFVDPMVHPERAQQLEVTQLGTIVLSMDGQKQTVTRVEEQELTGALMKLLRPQKQKIYFLTGHGEKDAKGFDQKGLSKIKDALEKENYAVEDLVLARQEAGVPADAAVVVIAGPEKAFFENEVKSLEAYLDGGGRALIMLDPNPFYGMEELLAKWGITVNDDMLIDVSPVGRLVGYGPTVPLVNSYEYHDITKDFRLMTFFPLARSIEKAEKTPAGVTVTTILKTSEQAWAESDRQALAANQAKFDEGADRAGPLGIVTVATKDVGAKTAETKDEAAPGDQPEEAAKKVTRLVVAGDSDFASNVAFDQAGNSDLALNAINWLAGEDALISIRPKEHTDPRVTLTENQIRNIFWLTVILSPLAIVIIGISVWVRRR